MNETSPATRTQFDYLLNAMEHAGNEAYPAKAGYADKRRALYAYVRELERVAARPVAAPLTDAARYRDALWGLVTQFPTDSDLAEAGWASDHISAACDAYDRARALLAEQPAMTDGMTASRTDATSIIAKWLRADHIRLHAGEMTAQEMRTVQAVLRGVLAEVTSGVLASGDGALLGQCCDGEVPVGEACAVEASVEQVLGDFERKERGIPQAHIAADLVRDLRAALASGVKTVDGGQQC